MFLRHWDHLHQASEKKTQSIPWFGFGSDKGWISCSFSSSTSQPIFRKSVSFLSSRCQSKSRQTVKQPWEHNLLGRHNCSTIKCFFCHKRETSCFMKLSYSSEMFKFHLKQSYYRAEMSFNSCLKVKYHNIKTKIPWNWAKKHKHILHLWGGTLSVIYCSYYLHTYQTKLACSYLGVRNRVKGSHCAERFRSAETKKWIETKKKTSKHLHPSPAENYSKSAQECRGGGRIGFLDVVCLWLIPAALSECININWGEEQELRHCAEVALLVRNILQQKGWQVAPFGLRNTFVLWLSQNGCCINHICLTLSSDVSPCSRAPSL